MRALRCWENFCSLHHANPLKPTEALAEAWLAALYGLYARNTICSRFIAVRLFFRHQGKGAAFDSLPIPRPEFVAIRPYSDAELRALLDAADSDRDRTVVLLLLGSGMRAAELVTLRFADVDWPTGRLCIVGKGNKPRVVCPGKAAMQALERYADGRRNGYVFTGASGHLACCSLWLLIERLARKAGIDGGVHRMRHTFAHSFLAAGGDVGDLRILLGHSSLAMSLRYASYYEMDRALDAMRRFNPADALFQNLRTPDRATSR